MPFTDPIADGPTIQKSNTVCDSYTTEVGSATDCSVL
jgi:tryptophan synthase alpha subunit